MQKNYTVHILLRQFLSFAGVGVIGTSAHYLTLLVLVHGFNCYPVSASAIGFVVGAVVNYVLNYHFTFRSSKHHYSAFIQFFSIALVGLGMNTLVMSVLLQAIGLHYLICQVIATCLVLIWNFAGNRFWTFC
jgi:putative flippase GtrA